MNESWHTYDWVMSNIQMSYVTDTFESCHTCACMSHTWLSHVTQVEEEDYEAAMAALLARELDLAWTSHGTHMNESWHAHMKESWHTFEWVMAHIWMGHGTHMNESCLTYEWDHTSCMSMAALLVRELDFAWTSHGTQTNESCLTYEWAMAHIWISHEAWHTYKCIMSHIWVSHVARMNASRHRYEWVMAHIWMTYASESWHTCGRVMSHIWMSHVTHMNESDM